VNFAGHVDGPPSTISREVLNFSYWNILVCTTTNLPKFYTIYKKNYLFSDAGNGDAPYCMVCQRAGPLKERNDGIYPQKPLPGDGYPGG
jgi:hypothetical protein